MGHSLAHCSSAELDWPNRKVMAAKALIVLGLAACATASGSSYQRVWRQDGYDRVPTEYGVRVNGYNAYVDEPKFGRLGKRDASGESYQRVWRVDGYDQVPTEYGVRVNGYNAYVDEDRVGRLGKRSTPYAPALAFHPAGYGYGAGYSYTDRSPQGLHKREAEPSRYSFSYGVDAYDGSQYVERYQNDGYGYGYHKREAEPSYAPALAYHPAGYGYGYNKGYGAGYSYVDRSPQGLHKRSTYGYTPALAYHPAGGYGYNKYGPGYSYTYRSTQGLHKREAEPSQYSYSYGVDAYDGNQYVERYQNDGYGYGYHKREAEPSYAPALACHPAGGYGYNKYGPGYSYVSRSPQGLHKRSTYGYTPALAYHPAGGYGYNKYGPGTSYVYRSPQGLHKREAEPSYAPALAYHPAGYGYGAGYSYVDRSPQGLHKREASGTSYQTVDRKDCYGYNCQSSSYDVNTHGYNGDVDEPRDGKNFAFQYGFNN